MVFFYGGSCMANAKLVFGLSVDLQQFNKGMLNAQKKIRDLAKSFQITAPSNAYSGLWGFSRVGVAVAAAKKIQDAYKAIQVGTGATGTALRKLQEEFRKVAVSGPQSFQESATAIADLNTRLGLSGEPLRKMSQTMLDLTRLTGGELSGNIASVTKAMNAWGVSAQSGGKFVNDLYVIAQNTGDSVSHLSDVLAANSGTLMALGMTYEESTAAIGLLEKSGLRSEKAMKTLKSVLNSLLKAGVKDTSAGFQTFIESIRNASNETEATRLAITYCGNEGATFARAIRAGAFNVDELTGKLAQLTGQMNKDANETKTFGEKWSQMMNQAGIAVQPLGEKVLRLTEYFIPLIRWTFSLESSFSKFIATLGAGSMALSAFKLVSSYFLGKWANVVSVFHNASLKVLAFSQSLQVAGKMKMLGDASAETASAMLKTAGAAAKLKAAFVGLGTFLLSPAGLIAAVAALAIGLGVYGYVKSAQQAQEETDKLQKTMDDYAASLNGLTLAELNRELETQKKRVVDLTGEYESLNAEINELMSKQRGYDPSLQAMGLAVSSVPDEVINKNLQIGQNAKAREDANARIKYLEDRIKSQAEFEKRQRAARASARNSGTGVKSSTSKGSGKSAVERRIEQMQDAIKYLGADPASFLGELGSMYAKMPSALTDDKKKVIDMQREIANKQKENAQKHWDAMKWQNSAGFLGDDQYAASLEQRLASLTGGADFSKWSEEARGVFDELQRVMSEQLAPSLDSLKERFANGQITLGEYETQLESLKAKYQEYPAITKDLQKEMDAAKKSSQTFLSGMTAAIKDAKASFDNMSVTLGTGLADGFARAIAYGEDLGSTLQKLGQDIIYTVTKMLLLQSITRMFSGLFGGGSSNPLAVTMDGLDAVSGHASGDAFGPAGLVPFANGGIVGRPTLFKFAGGTGLMGEAGPEAIMPLQRDSQGRLGVSVANNAQAAGNVTYAPVINVNVENNGSGEMSAQQANQMSRQVRDVVDARIADQLSEYKRRGFFHAGAYA